MIRGAGTVWMEAVQDCRDDMNAERVVLRERKILSRFRGKIIENNGWVGVL